MKKIINFEAITQTPLESAFTEHRIVSNTQDDSLYVRNNFKQFLTQFLQKFKNKQKTN